jgi:hypothetical protein
VTYQPPQYGQQPHQPTQGQGYGPPPPGWPGIEAPKKKRKWPWIVGGIVLAGILGCVGLFTLVLGGTGAAINEMDKNTKGQNAAAGAMGKPAKDGKFQFTVTKMSCGATQVGSEFLNAKAQGQFCQVSVTVKNVGQSAEIFDGGSQKAYDAAGTEYSYDTTASLYVNDQNQTFLEEINPGNQVKGVLVFDVPDGTKLTSIVLHESTFTAGVRIPLK